jgi:hypothetical protein
MLRGVLAVRVTSVVVKSVVGFMFLRVSGGCSSVGDVVGI